MALLDCTGYYLNTGMDFLFIVRPLDNDRCGAFLSYNRLHRIAAWEMYTKVWNGKSAGLLL